MKPPQSATPKTARKKAQSRLPALPPPSDELNGPRLNFDDWMPSRWTIGKDGMVEGDDWTVMRELFELGTAAEVIWSRWMGRQSQLPDGAHLQELWDRSEEFGEVIGRIIGLSDELKSLARLKLALIRSRVEILAKRLKTCRD